MNTLTPSHNFIAIDVEYSDNEQHICQIGIAKVENLEIIGSHSWLIQPPCDYYDESQMRVHHLTPEATAHAADFEQVWQEVQPILLMSELWAHNAASTEQPVLEKNLRMYGFNTDWLCVYDSRDLYQRHDCPANSGNSLPLCCKALGIEFDDTRHHDAEYDALKCAEIVIAHLKGQQPDWSGIPKSTEQLRKQQQPKLVLEIGKFAAHQKLQDEMKKAGLVGDKIDLFANITSTYEGAQSQMVDVFDRGDQMQKDGSDLIDIARLDTSDGNPLRGKVVAITGAFHISRPEIERALEAMGATTDGMTRNTNILLVGNRNVGLPKLAKYEKQTNKGRKVALAIGDDDLDALLYGDGHKFFSE